MADVAELGGSDRAVQDVGGVKVPVDEVDQRRQRVDDVNVLGDVRLADRSGWWV